MVKDLFGLLQIADVKPDEEIVDFAKRILRVYGKADFPTLDREIERMTKMLDIPLEEVLPSG